MGDGADDIRRLVTDFANAVFNDHDVDRANQYFAPDFVEHDPWQGFPPTVEGFKEGTNAFLAGFPDTRCQIEDVLVEGDRAVMRSRLIGTNTGSFMGMPPTGKAVDVQGIDMVRVAGGRMVEHWGVYDAAGMMMQLGVVPGQS